MAYLAIVVGLFWGVYGVGIGYGLFRLEWKDHEAEMQWKAKYGLLMKVAGFISLAAAATLIVIKFFPGRW